MPRHIQDKQKRNSAQRTRYNESVLPSGGRLDVPPTASSLRLDRQLDLRICEDMEELLRAISGQPYAVQLPIEDIEQGINALVHFLPAADWLKSSPAMGGGFVLWTSQKSSWHLPLEHAAQLGLQFRRLQYCEGFDDFLRGFTNPTQFRDSMFEAAVADYCLPRVDRLCFGPAYHVRGRIKRPDFELTTKHGDVVCECKRAHEVELLYAKRFDRFCKALSDTLNLKESGGIANHRRLEVHVHRPFGTDVQQIAKQVVQAARQMLGTDIGQVSEVGPCLICLVPRSSAPTFKDFGLWQLALVVGDKPVGIDPANAHQHAYLQVTTARVDPPRVKASGNLIRQAKSQLPEDRWGVIFIEAINWASARKAARLRLGRPEYGHVLACGIDSPDGRQFVHRTDRQAIIDDLFGPFTSDKASYG